MRSRPREMPPMPEMQEFMEILASLLAGDALSIQRGPWVFTAHPDKIGAITFCHGLMLAELCVEESDLVFRAGPDLHEKLRTPIPKEVLESINKEWR